jgi:hypothetical protein
VEPTDRKKRWKQENQKKEKTMHKTGQPWVSQNMTFAG